MPLCRTRVDCQTIVLHFNNDFYSQESKLHLNNDHKIGAPERIFRIEGEKKHTKTNPKGASYWEPLTYFSRIISSLILVGLGRER